MGKKKLQGKIKKASRLLRKKGKPPGTVTYMGMRDKEASKVSIISYNEADVRSYRPKDIQEILDEKNSNYVSWIDISGLTDETFVENLGAQLHLNTLILEDTVNVNIRPKVDEYEDYIFAVLKMLYLDAADEVVIEQVAFVLVKDTVLVFQEVEMDVFNAVRERIETKSGRVRRMGADYLFFCLMDAIVDNYFVILEHISAKVDQLEDEVYDHPIPEVARKIQDLKKEVMKVRRVISPVKEMVGRLIDTQNPLITKDTKLFLRDILDHTIEINESLQIYREMIMSLMEMYMSNMSNKMNEVMKVLTIMASIFIPLTFIAGIYGMNFDNMPELHSKNGYFVVWGVMIVIFIGMMIYFKRRRWL